MKYTILFLFLSIGLFSQNSFDEIQFASSKRIIEKAGSINLSEIESDFNPSFITLREFPQPGGEYFNNKLKSDKSSNKKSSGKTKKNINQNNRQASADTTLAPIVLDGFKANYEAYGIPLDNDLAISNDGWLVTVANSNIYLQNVNDSIEEPLEVSLVQFSVALGDYSNVYDPKVIYDPNEDRFILTFLNEYDSSNSSVIVGFSADNDPSGLWYLYELPGNPFNTNTWTDYPMVALTETEFFLTVNLLQDNTGWIEGFTKTIVWQVDKFSGYNGEDQLNTKLWDQNYLEGSPLRNGMPVKGGSQLYGPNLFMLSNRNFAPTPNDSIFLLEITGGIDDPDANINVTVLNSPVPYGAPPNVTQRSNPKDLTTNDGRILGSYFENNQIHFVSVTQNFDTEISSIYHGTIRAPGTDSVSLSANIISDPIEGFGYPNISFTGQAPQDDQFLLTFEYSSFQSYPGIFAMFYHFGDYSEKVVIKEGEFSIAGPAGDTQRWGDYTGSQRKYNEPGVVWINGTYGKAPAPGGFNVYRNTWNSILKSPIDTFKIDTMMIDTMVIDTMNMDTTVIDTMDQLTAVDQTNILSSKTYPNPARDYFIVEFELKEKKQVHAILYDPQGNIVQKLLRKTTNAGINQFRFSTSPLPPGTYFLTIHTEDNTLLQEKIVIQ